MLTMSGCCRVNGRLAVSRAIGDYQLKDVVIGEPDIVSIPLSGKEDFLLLACDGLWDFVDENEAAAMVYEMLKRNEGKFCVLRSAVDFPVSGRYTTFPIAVKVLHTPPKVQ